MKIRLSRNKHSFCYIGDVNTYKLNILSATLFIRKAKINPDVMLAHAMVLEKNTAKYPINRVETKVLTLSQGIMNTVQDNISTGAIPSRVVLAMVDSDAYNGVHNKNPFNFKHNFLSKVSFSIDGEDAPYKALELDFENNRYTRGFHSLFLGTNKTIPNCGSVINLHNFGNGYAIFAFDLTGDLTDGSHFNLVRSGNLRMNLTFAKKLDEAICCIIYIEFQNLIEINKNRQVLFDYKI